MPGSDGPRGSNFLPPALRELLSDPGFWSAYHFWEPQVADADYPALEDCRVEFGVADGWALVLTLEPSLSYFSLGLLSPGHEQPVEVAWDDTAHFHPHLLRWDELHAVCRAVALREPSLPHPGLPLLLLSRFAPICRGDEIPAIVGMLETAWREALPGVSARVIRDRVEALDRRQDGFEWALREPHGWFPSQPESARSAAGLYSLRDPENPDFPFPEWRQFAELAREASDRAPKAPVPEASFELRPRHDLQIEIAMENGRANPALAGVLDEALARADQGGASSSGATFDAASICISHSVAATVRGDLDEGLGILRGALVAAGVPENTEIRGVDSGRRWSLRG
jgi:hypothetical protein